MRSMTGYVGLQEERAGRLYSIEIRSLNNRYLELDLRIPRLLHPHEQSVRELVSGRITRGKVQVSIEIRTVSGARPPRIDMAFAEACHAAFEAARLRLDYREPVPFSLVLQTPGVVNSDTEEDVPVVWKAVKEMLGRAIGQHDLQRCREGKHTLADLKKLLKQMRHDRLAVMRIVKNGMGDARRELEERLRRYTDGQVDEGRLLAEAALLAGRADINEELSRLASHLDLFEQNILGEEPCGRTLDFICQELNREVNTIGSKQAAFPVSQLVINLKSNLERLREQARNVE
jgi:uncharacterized protein (TIGR00255 family)